MTFTTAGNPEAKVAAVLAVRLEMAGTTAVLVMLLEMVGTIAVLIGVEGGRSQGESNWSDLTPWSTSSLRSSHRSGLGIGGILKHKQQKVDFEPKI